MEIWNAAKFFIALARDGVHAHKNAAVPASSGEAFIVVNPQLATNIIQHGVILQSQGVWIQIDHPMTGKLGIANIYAPNSSTDRITLWRHLFDTLEASIPWIFIGDWNMVENFQDQRSGTNSPLAGKEKRVWNHFKRRLNLIDNFTPKQGHLHFLWDNRQQFRHDPMVQASEAIDYWILKRLDRCYHSANLSRSILDISSTILSGFNLLDHAPLLVTL